MLAVGRQVVLEYAGLGAADKADTHVDIMGNTWPYWFGGGMASVDGPEGTTKVGRHHPPPTSSLAEPRTAVVSAAVVWCGVPAGADGGARAVVLHGPALPARLPGGPRHLLRRQAGRRTRCARQPQQGRRQSAIGRGWGVVRC